MLFRSPITCEILAMRKSAPYLQIMDFVSKSLSREGVNCHKDTKSRSIGKRYSIIDEVGTPFVITIDEQTDQEYAEDPHQATVTIRDRDTMTQIRRPISDLASSIRDGILFPPTQSPIKE